MADGFLTNEFGGTNFALIHAVLRGPRIVPTPRLIYSDDCAGEHEQFCGKSFNASPCRDITVSKTTEADDRGRIVIPHKIREKYGDRYRIVELNDRVELIPLKEDPIEGLRDAVGNAFEGKSIAEIKQGARDAAREKAIEEVTESEKR